MEKEIIINISPNAGNVLELAFKEPILGFITAYNGKQIRGLAMSDGKNKTVYLDKHSSASEVRKAPPFFA